MPDDARFDHLRPGAIELLDAGNSTASVAQVLGVPASVVARWRSEPAPAKVDAIAAQRSRTGAVHFRTTLTLSTPLVFGLGHYALGVLACGDLIAQLVMASRHPVLTLVNLAVLVVCVGAIVVWLGVSRTLLVLGPTAAIAPGLLVRRSIAYADLSDYWLVGVVRGRGDDEIEGRLLTLHSRRAGVRPIEVFIDDRLAIDPALIERLDEVKAANRGVGPLTPDGLDREGLIVAGSRGAAAIVRAMFKLSPLLAAAWFAGAAHADCTLVADAATQRILKQEGACDTRVTPASTFKIAISLMGYDAGFLKSEHDPVLHYRQGDPDWNDNWRADTDPQKWIRDSVVWYSQRVTAALGPVRFQRYATAFHIGNEDVSGDPKKHDGLKWAWISSSLQVSPREELGFLERVVRRELPVKPLAYEMTSRVTAIAGDHGGWEIHGKTGAAFPRLADGGSDHVHGIGWFVGWAMKDGRTLVFVRQTQDQSLQEGSPGLRARDAFLPGLPALLDAP